jgi:hypothetical protein
MKGRMRDRQSAHFEWAVGQTVIPGALAGVAALTDT